MAGDEKIEVGTILTDESPANATVAGHWSGTIDCLNLADGAGIIFDEVSAIQRDGERAASVENDVDHVVGGIAAGEKCGNEVGVEICAGQMGV